MAEGIAEFNEMVEMKSQNPLSFPFSESVRNISRPIASVHGHIRRLTRTSTPPEYITSVLSHILRPIWSVDDSPSTLIKGTNLGLRMPLLLCTLIKGPPSPQSQCEEKETTNLKDTQKACQ